MDTVTRGMNWVFTLVYLDNIIVFLSTFEEHLEHLAQLFACLCEANLKLKASKCLFCQHEDPILGPRDHAIVGKSYIERKLHNLKGYREWGTKALRDFKII